MKSIRFTSNIHFKGFFDGIDSCPVKIVSQVKKACQEKKELKQYFKGNFINSLFSLPDEILLKHQELYYGKKIIGEILNKLEENFNLYLSKQVQRGIPLAEAHVNGIKAFLELDELKEFSIDNVEISSSNPEDSHYNMFAIETVLSLFPESLREDLDKIILDDETSRAIPSEKTIVLKFQENALHQMGEAIHEYAHLIDTNNLEIRKENIDFLKKRVSSTEKVSMKDCFDGNMLEEAEEVRVYPNDLVDAYGGVVYGTLEDNSPSEVLSLGLQALVLNPTAFFIRDNDYFNFVKDFLKNK